MSHAHDPSVRVVRLIVTVETDIAIHRLLADLRTATGSTIDFSTMTRALWGIAIDANEELRGAAGVFRVGHRPQNGDTTCKSAYESRWGRLIAAGLADAYRSAASAPGHPLGGQR